LGTSWDSGTVAHSYTGNVVAGTECIAEIDFTELYQEGSNRVNIYGKSLSSGTWTPYDTSQSSPTSGEVPNDVTNLQVVSFDSNWADLSWVASTSSDVKEYIVYFNNVEHGRTTETTYSATGLNPSTSYTVKVTTLSNGGLESSGATTSFTTLVPPR
jgi:hypothetical protein